MQHPEDLFELLVMLIARGRRLRSQSATSKPQPRLAELEHEVLRGAFAVPLHLLTRRFVSMP